MMTPILVCLIGVRLRPAVGRWLHARRTHESQAKGIVIGLVRAVFAISQNGRSEAATFIGQVDPSMRGNFKLALLGIGPLNSAELPIVSSIFIRCCKRKGHFQIGVESFPVNSVAELDTIARIARRKADCLNKL